MASVIDIRVRQFLRWWGGELLGLLPGPVARAFFPAPRRVELVLSEAGVRLLRVSGR